MGYYGPSETWKIVYLPKDTSTWNGTRCVALVEAENHQHAMHTFMTQYAGQYFTIQECKKLLG